MKDLHKFYLLTGLARFSWYFGLSGIIALFIVLYKNMHNFTYLYLFLLFAFSMLNSLLLEDHLNQSRKYRKYRKYKKYKKYQKF